MYMISLPMPYTTKKADVNPISTQTTKKPQKPMPQYRSSGSFVGDAVVGICVGFGEMEGAAVGSAVGVPVNQSGVGIVTVT